MLTLIAIALFGLLFVAIFGAQAARNVLKIAVVIAAFVAALIFLAIVADLIDAQIGVGQSAPIHVASQPAVGPSPDTLHKPCVETKGTSA